ncbi:MAG: 50S ribosomal protein L5 [Nanoarchaeota archaeon]
MKTIQVLKTGNEGKGTDNIMRDIKIDKVILNVGAGNDEAKLNKSLKLLELLSGQKPIKTLSKKRIPTWHIRPGLAIGCMVTLRKKKAEQVLKRILEAKENKLSTRQFIPGSLSFGIKEYIQIPGMTYSREIGIIGFDVSVSLKRSGFRIQEKKIRRGKIPAKHRISKEETINFFKENFNLEVK